MQNAKKKESPSGRRQIRFNIVRVSCHAILLLILLCSIHPVRANPDDWISPTGYEDPDGFWSDEVKGYDENTGTSTFGIGVLWSKFLVFTHDVLTSDKLRFWCNVNSGAQIDVDVWDGSSWIGVYQGVFAVGQWVEKSFSKCDVSKMRIRLYGTNPWLNLYEIFEVDFWEVEAGAEEYSFTFYETINISTSLNIWKAKMFSTSETVSVATDSCFWKEKLFSSSEFLSVSDSLNVLKEKLLTFVEFFETINPSSEAVFVFPSPKIPVLFIELIVVAGLIAFIFLLSIKKRG
jgi:hypothetical protein